MDGKYVVEGKVCYGNTQLFVETGTDEKGYPVGVVLEDLLKNNIKEYSNVTIIINFDRKDQITR